MNKVYNPKTIAAPVGAYSHAVEIAPGARTLFISGQVGVTPDGKVGAGITAQAEAVWGNIVGILKAAGMDVRDLVKVNILLVNPDDIAPSRAVRNRFLGDHKPASTLAVISRLAAPEYLIEIEAVAAKA